MTVITNEPMRPAVSTDMTAFERRADTFVTWQMSVYPESSQGPGTTRTFEKATFRSMLPLLYSRHRGEYVAVARGEIADHDPVRAQLVRRFFSSPFSNNPVYIGYVGPREVVRVPTPIIRRTR